MSTGGKRAAGKKVASERSKLERSLDIGIKSAGGGGGKKAKERKVTGLKDQVDINMDVERARELQVEVGLSNELGVSLKRKADHTPSTQLLPQRKNQTLDTLAVRANDRRVQLDEETETGGGGVLHATGDNVDLYRELVKTNEQLYRQRNNCAGSLFALSDLIRLGLLSSQTPSADSRQAALAHQYADSVVFMRDQLKQLARIAPSPQASGATDNSVFKTPGKNVIVLTRELAKNRRKAVGDGGGGGGEEDESGQPMASTAKLRNVFGALNFTCTYLRHASNDYKKHICPIYDKEKNRVTRAFFVDDCLEEDVPPGSLPSCFKIFQRLQEANMAKYRQHEAAMRDLSSQAPRVALEVVPRAHIKRYRYRPRPESGDQLCINGTRCYFYTFSSDPEVRYVGKVFRTPRQLELLEKDPQALPRDCVDYWLCIDCLLASWTRRHADNFVKERAPKQVGNHFAVAVGKGEYSEACMLHRVFNKLVTGFVGNVPQYHESHRAVAEVTLRHLGQQHDVTESYIGEIGMDF